VGKRRTALFLATAGSAVLLGCGGSDRGVDVNDPVAVGRDYVEMSLTCRNPDIVYVMACKPHYGTDVKARVVRHEGEYVLVATTLDGAPGGALWLVRTGGGYKVSRAPRAR